MEYLFVISLAWFIREFEPIQFAVAYLKDRFPTNAVEYLLGSFDCIKCLTFWTGLLVTFSFKEAVIASFIAFSLELAFEVWSRKK